MSSAFIPIPESSTDIINLTISPFIIVFILNSIYPLLVYLILLSNIMVNTFFRFIPSPYKYSGISLAMLTLKSRFLF